jgi:hypothetical protein
MPGCTRRHPLWTQSLVPPYRPSLSRNDVKHASPSRPVMCVLWPIRRPKRNVLADAQSVNLLDPFKARSRDSTMLYERSRNWQSAHLARVHKAHPRLDG